MKNVKAITANWFEIKVRIQKVMDDGFSKTVRMVIATDAKTCTEAELNGMAYFATQGLFVEGVDQISRARYNEVFFNETGIKFYRTVVKHITEDEKTGKDKLQAVYYLVQADTLDQAREIINDAMSNTVMDYLIFSITETNIEEVLPHISSVK